MRTSDAGVLPRNRFGALLTRVEALPLPRSWQQRIVTLIAGATIPYLATCAIELEQVSPQRATLALRNRRKVQNHMKTVHGSAMLLLAEAATGTVLTRNLPDGSRYSTTHVEGDYTRRSQGDLRAVAELSAEEQARIQTEEKGRLRIPVTLTDESGAEPARFVMEWSWKHPARKEET